MHGRWSGSPELLELVAANEGEGRWRGLASLARATDGAPGVAKYCLNKALLARLPTRYGKAGRSATNLFTVPDFIEARKIAMAMDWTARPARPWDEERYERISESNLKIYRGVLLPKTRYPGKENSRGTSQIDPTLDVQEAAINPGQSSQDTTTTLRFCQFQ